MWLQNAFLVCKNIGIEHPNRLTAAEIYQWMAYLEIENEPQQYGKLFQHLKAKLDGNRSKD